MLAGRLKTCAVYIRHETVSREHAEFRSDLGKYWVKDFGSRNGTLVNSKPVTESVLVFGDLIQLGDVVLKIESRSCVMQCSSTFQSVETKFRSSNEDKQPTYLRVSDSKTFADTGACTTSVADRENRKGNGRRAVCQPPHDPLPHSYCLPGTGGHVPSGTYGAVYQPRDQC